MLFFILSRSEILGNNICSLSTSQVDVKRTVPKKGAASTPKWGTKTKKIFLGGLPTSVTEGVNLLHCY
jgi:hypothetical protein